MEPFALLTQADHPSLVARQLQLLLAEHCNRRSRLRGGTRRGVKKSVISPAQRKGMSPLKAVEKVGDGIRFYSIIVGESNSVRVGPFRVVSVGSRLGERPCHRVRCRSFVGP